MVLATGCTRIAELNRWNHGSKNRPTADHVGSVALRFEKVRLTRAYFQGLDAFKRKSLNRSGTIPEDLPAQDW